MECVYNVFALAQRPARKLSTIVSTLLNTHLLGLAHMLWFQPNSGYIFMPTATSYVWHNYDNELVSTIDSDIATWIAIIEFQVVIQFLIWSAIIQTNSIHGGDSDHMQCHVLYRAACTCTYACTHLWEHVPWP